MPSSAYVTTPAELVAAVANPEVARILIVPGTYLFGSGGDAPPSEVCTGDPYNTTSALCIARNLTIEASHGTVVLDAQGTATARRRLISIGRMSDDDPPIHVQLTGLSITGGYALNGGGVAVYPWCRVVLTDLDIYGNAADATGYVDDDDEPRDATGGGMNIEHADVHVSGCRVFDNTVDSNGGAYGGGCASWSRTSNLDALVPPVSCLVRLLVCSPLRALLDRDAAVRRMNMESGILTVTGGSVIHSNRCGRGDGNVGDGGGVFLGSLRIGVTAMFDGVSVHSNVASTGAGMYIRRSVVSIRHSRIDGNDAVARGGDSTEGNAAAGGGLYFEEDSSVEIEHTDITRNTVSGRGGGVFVSSGGRLELRHSRLLLNDVSKSAAGGGGGGCALFVERTANSSNAVLVNNTFDSGGLVCASNTMISIGNELRFICQLGSYMPPTPLSVDSTSAFQGCKYPCPASTFGNTSGLTSPLCSGPCPLGHYCPEATVVPTPCPPGRHITPIAGVGSALESCLPCAPGSYNPTPGRAHGSCIPCPVGTLSDGLYSTSCGPCPLGGYCATTGAASVRQTFEPCPAGTYNPIMGASGIAACIACPRGKASPIPGSVNAASCHHCLPGSYAPTNGTAVCTLCAPGTYTPDTGSTVRAAPSPHLLSSPLCAEYTPPLFPSCM